MTLYKMLSAAAAALALTAGCICPMNAAAKEQKQKITAKYGDLNTDGSIDVADAVLLARFCAEDKDAKISAETLKFADTNHDKEINGADTIAILEYIAKIRKTLEPAQDEPPVPETTTAIQTTEATYTTQYENATTQPSTFTTTVTTRGTYTLPPITATTTLTTVTTRGSTTARPTTTTAPIFTRKPRITTTIMQTTTQTQTTTLLQTTEAMPETQETQVQMDFLSKNLMEGYTAEDVKSKPADDKFSYSQLALSLGLLKQTNSANTGSSNLMISPLSVSYALSMTANGAKGQTRDEMEALLGSGLTIEELNAYQLGLIESSASENNPLKIANSIWFRSGITVLPEFLQLNKNYYDADIYEAPFNQQTIQDVNSWVNDKTHQMIPKVLDPNQPLDNVLMYLINALAFEAEWEDAYTLDAIHQEEFTCSKEKTMLTDMMYSEEHIYLEDKNAVGFIKPYKDCNYSFAAILPNKDISVQDYINNLTAESLQSLLKNRQKTKVNTAMPKFKFEYEAELKDSLSALGMEKAFADADFSGIFGKPVAYISSVLHKTFVAVDELGTKAGAVTVVVMEKGVAPGEPPKYVMLNRPFVFMILNNDTQTPVFIGYVTQPSEATVKTEK